MTPNPIPHLQLPGLRAALLGGRAAIAKGQVPDQAELEHDGQRFLLRFERFSAGRGRAAGANWGFVLRLLTPDDPACSDEFGALTKTPTAGVCRLCGCTEDNACVVAGGDPCGWMYESKTLCTACFGNQVVRSYFEFKDGSHDAVNWLAGRARYAQPTGGAR